MAVYKQKDSKNWWYKFVWNGDTVRESTKQTNKRVAEQMEAAHRTALAKGEVGIRKREPAPTLTQFLESEFSPFIESRFPKKPKTLEYYRNGIKNLQAYNPLAKVRLDAIAATAVTGFIDERHAAELEVSSINRQFEVLRRVLHLAVEWGKIEKAPLKITMLPGENERDRVLTAEEETSYLTAAQALGEGIEDAYQRALTGIRAKRGKVPIPPQDPTSCATSPRSWPTVAFGRKRRFACAGATSATAHCMFRSGRRRAPIGAFRSPPA